MSNGQIGERNRRHRDILSRRAGVFLLQKVSAEAFIALDQRSQPFARIFLSVRRRTSSGEQQDRDAASQELGRLDHVGWNVHRANNISLKEKARLSAGPC